MVIMQQQVINAATFAQLMLEPEYDNEHRIELIEGEIVQMSKLGGLHGLIAGNVFGFLWNYARENQLGYVTAAETGYILARRPDGRDSVRGLDVGFIRNERLPDGMPQGHIPLAPDLAVEVVSEGNTAPNLHSKVLELQAAGTPLIWLIYPETRTVVVQTGNTAHTLTAEDVLDGGDVLPGFSLPIRQLFGGI